MKNILFVFLILLWPQQGHSRARCPVNMTQEECCAQDSTLTLTQCNAQCSGTCSLAFYGGCYKCSVSLKPFNPIGNDDYVIPSIPDLEDDFETTPEPVSVETVSSCPSDMKKSSDGCCCVY